MYPALYVLSSRLTGDGDAAKDIVSEVFLRLWEKRSALTAVKDIKAYLYISLKNASLDHLRKNERMQKRDIAAFKQTGNTEDFLERLAGVEKVRILYEAIHSLPTECQKVVLLGLEGHSPKEIAEQLSISASAVSNQKQRAVKLLREKLSPGILAGCLFLIHY